MLRSIVLAAAAARFLVAPLAAQEQDLPPDSMELGQQYTKWFLAYEADSLVSHMTPEFLERSGGIDQLVEIMDQVALNAGTEVEVMEARFVTRNGRRQFWHTGRFSQMPEPIQIRWVIDSTGRIAGAGINPLSQAPPTDP